MAYGDVEEPRPPAEVQPGTVPQPAQAEGSDVAGAWRNWLTNPENRASLMQFGASMLQPIGVGQSQAGHFGQALGQAGEAATRVRAEDMAKQKLASETDLREQRANLAESRARSSGESLSLQQEMLQLKQMLGTSQRATEMLKNFEAAKILNPELSLADYVKRHQQAMKIIAGEGGGASGAPAAATAAPSAGETRTYQGKQYRFKGGANTKENWEPL